MKNCSKTGNPILKSWLSHNPAADARLPGTGSAYVGHAQRNGFNEGIEAIELCGGLGNRGTGRIADAVAGKAAVGVVRFDGHPGLGGKSGDELF